MVLLLSLARTPKVRPGSPPQLQVIVLLQVALQVSLRLRLELLYPKCTAESLRVPFSVVASALFYELIIYAC